MARNGSTEETLARVEHDAAQLMAARTEGMEQREPATTGSEAASVLKHVEAIFERAVHSQVEPLRALVSETEQMITEQFDHLARIKSETQMLMLNGERAAALVTAIRGELAEMRSKHAEVVQARTT